MPLISDWSLALGHNFRTEGISHCYFTSSTKGRLPCEEYGKHSNIFRANVCGGGGNGSVCSSVQAKQTFMRCKAGCISYTQGHLIPRLPGGGHVGDCVFQSVLPPALVKMASPLHSTPLRRLEDTPCYPFAGCHRRASCTGSSPRRAMSGVSESSCGRSSPTGSSLGSSWATTR